MPPTQNSEVSDEEKKVQRRMRSLSEGRLDERIIRMRAADKTNAEIAETIGLPVSAVVSRICDLFESGEVERRVNRITQEERDSFHTRVLELRNEGLTREEILIQMRKETPKKLRGRVTTYRIASSLAELIQSKQITQKEGGVIADTARDELIVKYRNEGKTNEEIAEIANIPYGTVVNRVVELIKQKRLKKRKPGVAGGKHHRAIAKQQGKEAMLRLYRQHRGREFSIDELATRLEIAYSTAKGYRSELKAEGLI